VGWTVGTLTECEDTGYSAVLLSAGGWEVLTTVATYATVTFTLDDAGTIYGYYVTNPENNKVCVYIIEISVKSSRKLSSIKYTQESQTPHVSYGFCIITYKNKFWIIHGLLQGTNDVSISSYYYKGNRND
jgi:hypothetical protein